VIFSDESGFYLLPSVVRTYAPRGQAPVIRHKLSREHLSVISGVTPGGDLYLMVQDRACQGTDMVKFLQHLLDKIPGKLLLIWDGAPIHRSKAVKGFLAEGATARLHLECLPPYAPDLNPDEGVWRYLKHVELPNRSCLDLDNLRETLLGAVERLRGKPHILQACFQQVGYL
jgi:transposase